MLKTCTRCYHYYEIYKEKLCRSPHLGQSMVDGNNNEVSAEYERSCGGECGPDGEYFELCSSRMAKRFLGSIYDKDAYRTKANWDWKTTEDTP